MSNGGDPNDSSRWRAWFDRLGIFILAAVVIIVVIVRTDATQGIDAALMVLAAVLVGAGLVLETIRRNRRNGQ